MPGTLYLVPTPVGNLEDITFRAVKVLNSVSLICAEDTRTSGILLKHYEIRTPMRAFHMHNEHQQVSAIIAHLAGGQDVAQISDAGTPGISDPGFLLVRAAVAAGIRVEALPGATAFVPALVASGLPADKFVFEGFLPVKKGRQTRLHGLADEKRTLVFYESPHKINKTLRDFIAVFGPDRPASCSREISKKFEEHIRGSLAELLMRFEQTPAKGELVLCVGGAT
jgi:16S rRNA (cytidine1402-2'-O)-methyltransferase